MNENGRHELYQTQIQMPLIRKFEHHSAQLLKEFFYLFPAKSPVVVFDTKFRAASPAVKSDRTERSVTARLVSIDETERTEMESTG